MRRFLVLAGSAIASLRRELEPGFLQNSAYQHEEGIRPPPPRPGSAVTGGASIEDVLRLEQEVLNGAPGMNEKPLTEGAIVGGTVAGNNGASTGGGSTGRDSMGNADELMVAESPGIPSVEEVAAWKANHTTDGNLSLFARGDGSHDYWTNLEIGDPMTGIWGGCPSLNTREVGVYNLINQLRRERGLNELPLSRALTATAWYHCHNNVREQPDFWGCGLHSWMASAPNNHDVSYYSCCYQESTGLCMWPKADEISMQGIGSFGFEISQYSSRSYYLWSVERIVKAWTNSDGHRPVIFNEGVWSGYTWKSIGVAVTAHYSHVWFADTEDLTGYCLHPGDTIDTLNGDY